MKAIFLTLALLASVVFFAAQALNNQDGKQALREKVEVDIRKILSNNCQTSLSVVWAAKTNLLIDKERIDVPKLNLDSLAANRCR